MSRGADFLYLILLLILPISALLARRLPMGLTVKMALAWLAIFLGAFFLVELWQIATGAESALAGIVH